MEVRINLLTASEKLCTEGILNYDCPLCLVWETTGEEMKEKERQAQDVCQEKCCLQHSYPDKSDVAEIEIQDGERRGESFPAWMDVKNHILEMIWRKSQLDLQHGCWGPGKISVSQMSHKFAGVDVNEQDGGCPEPGLVEQEVRGRLSTNPHFRSSPGQRDPVKKDVEVGFVFWIKKSRNSFDCWIYLHYSRNSKLKSSISVVNLPTFQSS